MLGKCVNNGWIGKGIGSHHSLRGVSILCGGGFIPHNLGMENQHLEGGEAVAGILIQPGEPRGAQIDGELIPRINSGTNIIMVVGGTTEGKLMFTILKQLISRILPFWRIWNGSGEVRLH